MTVVKGVNIKGIIIFFLYFVTGCTAADKRLWVCCVLGLPVSTQAFVDVREYFGGFIYTTLCPPASRLLHHNLNLTLHKFNLLPARPSTYNCEGYGYG